MGLIREKNPEGPTGKPDPVAAARDIADLRSHAMNDEDGWPIAGTHLGKATVLPILSIVAGPEVRIEQQGLGWDQSLAPAVARHHQQRPLGRVDQQSAQVGQHYLEVLFGLME